MPETQLHREYLMQLTCPSTENGVHRVHCEGKISVPDFGTRTDPLEQLLGPDVFAGKILLNLDESQSIDSSGVGWLLRCQKRCKERGGAIVFHTIPAIIMNVLNLLSMSQVLQLADTEAAASELISGVTV